MVYLCINACFCLSEERKKAKLSYQESLQNVHTVRQQVAVRKLHQVIFSTSPAVLVCLFILHQQVLTILCFQKAKQTGQKRERAASDAGEESLKPNTKVSKTESETSVAGQSTKPAQNKKKQKKDEEPEVPEQNFTPFDYNQSNFKIFDGKTSALFSCVFFYSVHCFHCLCFIHTGKSKESSHFDPNRQAHGPKHKVLTCFESASFHCYRNISLV